METRFKLILFGNYSFVLAIQKIGDGSWEGRVIRFTIKPEASPWGKDCGCICRTATEDNLIDELNRIVSQHSID